MTTNDARQPLGRILLIDAATCAAMGGLLILGAGPIAGLTAMPEPLLFWAGVLLIPVAAYMALVARRATDSGAAVWLAILGNLGWVAASLALFAFVAPNALGAILVLGQAAVVAALAWAEFTAWRGAGTDRATA
jgi:hypothetical protein